MRHLLAFVLMIALVGSAAAADLGNVQKDIKTNAHVGMNPGTPDGRQGGETIADAVMIEALPYMDSGNTVGNIHDYDAVCPYSGGTAPDVVYSFTPAEDLLLSVDLCGSGYDTKTYVIDADLNIIDCNDDFYTGDPCGLYVSYIEAAPLMAGVTYYIVVDGYGTDAGDYVLNVDAFTPPPPCIITCDGVEEGEPTLGDGYIDLYNTGCNDDTGLFPFQDLLGDGMGELVFCGVSGWYSPDGTSEFRDTDWFTAVIGEYGMIEWTLDAEESSLGFLLSPQDCATVAVELSIEAGPCVPATLAIQGNPGDIVWLWVGPGDYVPPAGFVGNEYKYISTFTGLEEGIIATDNVSFDGIKSLYR